MTTDAASVRAWRFSAPPWMLSLTPALLLLPAAVLFASLFGSFVILARYSLSHGASIDTHGYTIAQYHQLFTIPYERTSLTNSAEIAGWVTGLAILLSYPLAMQLVRSQRRALLITVLLIPVLLDVVIRSYGWVLLLGPSGLVPRTIHAIGLGNQALLFNKTGIIIALVNELLPFMVIPVFISLAAIDQAVIEAAAVLGADRRRIFWKILFPLSAPGLISGAVIVFALAYSALAVPLFLGGGRVSTVALLIKNQMVELLNFPLGAAVAVFVGIVMVFAFVLAQKIVIRLLFSHYAA
jgi:putative spermidine/putrescine transport system permease protein